MSSGEEASTTGPVSERQALETFIEALQRDFPTVGATAVADQVREIHRRHDGAAVRDFVVLLVEHEARRRLTARTSE
jgi:hypothetical protein